MSGLTVNQEKIAEKINFNWKSSELKAGVIVLAVFFLLWLLPTPAGLNDNAWKLFAIFAATILGVILKPLPMGSIAIIATATCTITNTLTLNQALESFSSGIIWLILISFLLARGFVKTGLGSRIAYHFVYFFGKTTLGLAYGLVITETMLAPFTPSSTARGAGIIFPIASALSNEFNSNPNDGTQNVMGAYLMKVCYHTNIITSALFLTSMAANPIIAILAGDLGLQLSWVNWAMATFVPGIISLIVTPLIIYFLYPPEVKHTASAKEFATQKLAEMGSLKVSEITMIITFGLLLVLWVMGGILGVHPTSAALVGLSILLFTRVLEWDDILNEKAGWNTFIWLSTLLNMTNFLAKFGLMLWVSNKMQLLVAGMSWITSLPLLALIYFYSHYAFASLTAHITSMYSAFAMVAINTGAPIGLTIMLLAVFSNLCACLTHYGSGTAPIYFGTNYVSFKAWWRTGALISLSHLLIWGGLGSIWWKILGLW